MRRATRRATLYRIGAAAGAAGTVALAGCATGSEPDGSDGNESDENESRPDDSDDGSADVETTVHHVGRALSGPAWRRAERPGFCALIDGSEGTQWLFADADAETTSFLEATDFAESVLVYAESAGRTTCEGTVEFANVRVDDRTLLADATVVDTSGEDAVCGEAITHSGALLRVTTDPLPESLRVTVTDGWGTSAELTGQERVRDPAALDGSVRPDGEPPGVPAALDCPEESFERHPARYDGAVNWGSGGGIDRDAGLELRVVATERDGSTDASGGLRLERGDAFRVELTNVSRRPVGVGNEGKYNLEVDTEAGWTDVRGAVDGRFGYTDELIAVRPGAVVEWRFEMSEAGLVATNSSEDLRVCPALEPGRYRFVFWGADDIAVAFDYVG